MKKQIILLWFCFIMVFSPAITLAHDLWLIPQEFSIKPGQLLTIFANTGMDFPKSLNAVEPVRVNQFILIGQSERKKLTRLKIRGKSLTTACIIQNPGTYVVAMSLKPKEIKLKAKEFNEYLLHDGLKSVYELRKKEGILKRDAIEYYSKYPKTIIQVGDRLDSTPCKALNLPLEIIPQINPYRLKQGDSLTVTVLYKRNPLIKAELSWSFPGQGEKFAGVTNTDINGKAIIPLSNVGPYVIRITHMEWVKKETHEWESYWTSLTFKVLPKNKEGGA